MEILYLQALPGAGKTTEAKKNSRVIDTDPIIDKMLGEVTPDTVSELFGSDELAESFYDLVLEHDFDLVLSNLHLAGLPKVGKFFKNVAVVHYGDHYIDHIKACGRDDLLGFGEDTLSSWSENASQCERNIELPVGHFVNSIMVDGLIKKYGYRRE